MLNALPDGGRRKLVDPGGAIGGADGGRGGELAATDVRDDDECLAWCNKLVVEAEPLLLRCGEYLCISLCSES